MRVDATAAKELWAEVLTAAVMDAVGETSNRRKDRHQPIDAPSASARNQRRSKRARADYNQRAARAWIDPINPDFCTVCDLVGVDSSYIAAHVQRMIREGKELTTTRQRKLGKTDRGVGLDFAGSQGTGGGTAAQDSTKIDFQDQAI